MSEPLAVPGDAVPQRAEGALEAEIDGDLVLLGPANLDFFGTGGVGDQIWRLIDGTRSVHGLIDELEDRYDAPDGVIAAETRTYLEALHAAGLITL